MDTTLVTVTVLSMGMAAALSVIVWRLLRDERRRTDARVAALTAAASREFTPKVDVPRIDLPRTDLPPRAVVSTFRRNDRMTDEDLPLRVGDTPVTTSALFVEPVRSSPWGNRFAVMAGLALLLASVVLLAMTATKARPAGTARLAAAATAAAEPGDAGLELLSLRDTRKPDALVIAGMVQNPHNGALRNRIAVTAYAFDDKGAFLASGRALIDVT